MGADRSPDLFSYQTGKGLVYEYHLPSTAACGALLPFRLSGTANRHLYQMDDSTVPGVTTLLVNGLLPIRHMMPACNLPVGSQALSAVHRHVQ